MESKKDIYNLWIRYTTKNEEIYFRQFISGFVSVWDKQLKLNFDLPELSSAIQHDSGPHLSRLPDELLPAIGKFLIIARDNIDEGNFSCLQLQETELLLKCLIVICRHFENIEFVAKSDYVSNSVAIASIIIRKILHNDEKPLIDEINFIKAFSNFLEVLYDPYLTWRNYLNGEFSLFKTSNPQTIQLHVEIVPFIYECFESNKMLNLPELGNNIINILGSIICGSQQNGLRAICPATVSILKNLLSNWECNNELRKLGLNCYVMMVIILQKSSPEQRQLDVITVLQMYGEIFNELLKTKHFIIIKPFEENFEISNSNNYSQYIDINALLVTIDYIENLLKEPTCRSSICNAITEMNLGQRLINIPFEIQNWDINQQVIITSIIKIITLLSRNIENTKNLIINKKNLQTLFNGIKLIERPQLKLIIECVNLAYDGIKKKIIIGNILNELILWIKDIGEIEQNYLSDILLKICTANIDCKTVACHHRVIYTIAKCIGNYKLLTTHCAFDLIKIIEELGKHSIHPFELKEIFNLLRSEGNFIYRKQLLKAIVNISHHNITIGPQCTEFFDIQNETDCITVPEIRKWTVPNTYGFIFHAYLRFDKYLHDENTINDDTNINNDNNINNYRRQIFSLMTSDNTGFEIFLKKNGKLVIGVLTKKEFLAATVPSAHLLDGRWHFITICVIPSKRPFSYNQINVYIDATQKLGANVKFGSFTEHFVYCTIGSAVHKQRRISQSTLNLTPDKHETLVETHRQSSSSSGKGLFPSIMDRSFLPNLVSQVPNYFSLPSRNVSSLDPSVKSYPAGMQDEIFGEATCLKGQLGCVILAESTINIQTFLENGANFMRILSQDTEISDMMSKIIFCYSPSAYNDGLCVDLAPGSKYNGHVVAKHCRTIALQDCINCIGGVHTLLPVLENFSSNNDDSTTIDDGFKTVNLTSVESPAGDEYKDWEILQSSSYQEIKMSENMIACFLYLIRNFIMNHSLNQENLLKNEGVTLIGLLLEKCNPDTIDVNVLMAVQLLVEAVQSQIPQTNTELLQIFYSEIIFNFKIWSKTNFQITIGQIQYINSLIKDDRKYFRKKFGIQFILNVIKEYYIVPDNLTLDDCKTIRLSLLTIVKYYIQKELNVNEVNIIISFMAIEKHECIIIELIKMLISHMESKNCKDQIFLLMYEPHTAELLYSLFADKVYTSDLYEVLLKLFDCLLHTKRVSTRHKTSLRLIDTNLECHSLYPGLFSYMIPFNVSSNVINMLLDQTLMHDSEVSGYCGALALIHHLSLADLALKLEVCRKLLMTTFTKLNSPFLIAKQVDWQESIARLLIKKPITCSISNDDKTNLLVSDIDNFEEYSDTAKLIDENLITFDEKTMELTFGDSIKDGGAMLTEKLQASVSEAANVIENELKELADSVSGAVVGNITSVYSVIRQTTSDIQDTLESLAFGGSTDNDLSTKTRSSSLSSTEDLNQISLPKSPTYSKKTSPLVETPEGTVDKEEQLVFLVTNILFTVLWRGVDNNGGDSWKERGQVMACINLLGLNNELYCSHLTIRLRILEMGIQASLIDLAENGTQNLNHQQNAAQLLRMVYDLVVLDPNEDHLKKCSTKLLDGVLALLDALMVFQQASSDDWLEMTRLCLGLLLKCASHPDPDIVAMATAKLHSILQSRNSQDPQECGYLMYSINKALQEAIEVGHSELYSFLMPVMKALLEKTRMLFSLTTNVPDLPTTSSGPVFFHEFQMYSTTKQWTQFIEKKIKPLYDAFQKEVEKSLSEPLNIFWAECYEACKISSQKRAKMQMESRHKFQQKILMPWRLRQHEELTRLNSAVLNERIKYSQVERVWKNSKRFHYGPRGAWRTDAIPEQQFWKLSHHENSLRMRLKLEPTLYHDDHTQAANLRDNTAIQMDSRRLSTEFITPAVLRDINGEDELWLDEELRNTIESQTPDPVTATVEKEKIIITQECELVTLMTRVKGRLEVTVNQISFIDLTPANKEDGVKKDFKFTVNQIKEVHLRKYNLRRSALEIFLIDQISYFLNFTTKTRNKIFTKILSLQPPNILYGSGRSPSELLKASGLTQKWMTREISNFEYLMHLNTIAGRSYNDLSQYPVFPWILADYTNEILDLTNPKSFRDLSKPIGVVNPKNEIEVRVKYDGFEDPSGMIPKFHYGTHYSNSAGVLHYLLRVEPFTSLHIELQSGRFDVADRQFHSIPQTWKLLMDNPNDVKELIPEFFYFPEFLKNMNKFDLGVLQITKERVDDVILPPWAKTPEDFIAIHRRALESEFVSHNLHHWIDLIFGYKQKGPRAVEALNVFYYCSYEGAVDLDKIKNPTEREAVEGMINNFGQTPSQLLREAHPRRLTQDDIIMKLLKFELKRPDLTQFLDRIINVNCDMTTEKDPVIFLSQPRSPPRSFLQTSPDILVSITKSGILGSHSWISFDKEKGFLLEIDATTMNPKNKKQLIGPFHPSIKLNSQLFAVSHDGKLLYAGGIWDNSLKVFNINRCKAVASVVRHSDVITCLGLDNCGSYLVTGSRDCTCIVWSIGNFNQMGNASSYQGNSGSLSNLSSSSSGGSGVSLAGGSMSGGSSTSSGIGGLNSSAMNLLHNVNHIGMTTSSTNLNTPNNIYNHLTPRHINTLYGHDDAVTCCAINTELDLVVSGSLDGTVNVHTIHEGQFIRTLKPLGCTGLTIEISYLTISYQGHIGFSAFDDTSHSIHVFSINGTNLGSKYVSGRVTGLTTSNDFIIVADDAGDLTISRLYGLKPIYDIPLHIPVQTIIATPGSTHLMAPLRDGKIAIIGISQPTTNKKHSVMNV